jgi:phosphatidylinositol alpha-1,6-mannosyltransferase
MIIGAFPAFSSINYGGIEESALVASQAIESLNGKAVGATQFLCYGPQDSPAKPAERPGAMYAQSRSEAIWKVLKHGWNADTLFFWHIHLLQLLPAFRLPEARVVLFLHGIEAWKRQSAYVRHLLKRVDLVLSNSEHTWQRFRALNPAVKSGHTIVPLGIDRPAPDAELAASKAVALMLGRMDRREDYKGHREMIAAWPAVVDRIPGAELWIVGGGSLQPELERIALASPVHSRIRFFGRVSPERKQELLEQCRCLALPSRGEGFGLVYLEAMRLGRPCLVSTVDSGREVVNPPEAGLAADPGRPEELAAATCRLLTPGPQWNEFSERARRRYNSRFTAAAFQCRLSEALQNLDC